MQTIAEAAYAEARSVHDEVSSKIVAKVAKQADASASNVAEIMTGKVQQVAAQFEAQMSHVAT